ncbi:TspO and MBR related proteins [Filomicrobium insigne]|uniref:TspO and MBR related proteins n=1 Tax=Filomicrobium insigne TaxID=418854 RepID=A0A1H0N9N2_9HYPH|nr:TspO/MBR family protein [Filomicrobium insigne]SDO89383.1 TspO and MBR related proteins [Filomicrobium insigne]
MDGSVMRTVRNVLIAIAPVLAAGILGNLATIPNIPTWYAGLEKPAFTPPNWVFGPAWTTLYVLMAYAFFRVLQSHAPGRAAAIIWFGLQISVNALWSWVFFEGQNPAGGFVVILLLLVLIIGTTAAFWKMDRLAALLLVPYIGWATFAALLNWEIYRLN